MQRDTFTVERFPSLERFQSDFRGRTIDVCIATEEIIGPVRNGGIASTYYHLARGLAAQGHRVTVLYLKGRHVENETPEHWVEHYAGFGIDLVYLDLPEDTVLAAAARWQTRYYAFYRWLLANDRFQVIHTSEWRGGAFYCLQAKRMGLAFADTLFIVKTSSPHIWNRHYQMQPIEEADLLTAAFAEQKCVEWADMVVGGSAHLLSFMRHIGYEIPDGRTYTQPNIIDFSEVIVTDLRPERPLGDVMRTDELVFFGRLEPRKGLELFVDAINALVARGVGPSRLSFLGKEGERLNNRGNVKPLDFIAANARHWPFPVEIVTDRNQPEALSYMCSREMIAVMPSLIENSTMAVYEALVHRIPFIATGVGGTPELVGEAYHDACLIAPSAELLAASIERALRDGQPIATPAFDNDHNLETWYAFHRYVAEHGIVAIEAAHQNAESVARPHGDRISYLAYPASYQAARALLEGMAGPDGVAFDEAYICLSFLLDAEERAALVALLPTGAQLIDAIGVSVGDAFNRISAQTFGEILVFDASAGLRIEGAFAGTVRTALANRPDALISCFASFREDPLDPEGDSPRISIMPMGGDIASHYATNLGYGLELVALRAETQAAVGAFEPYSLSSGIIHEFVTRAITLGRDYLVVPEPLIEHTAADHPLATYGSNYQYLKSKPLLDAVPIYLKKILMMFLGRRAGARATEKARSFVWRANRDSGAAAWLTNVARIGDPTLDPLRRGPIVIGFDHRRSRLKIGLWGKGTYRLFINDELEIEQPGLGLPGVFSIRFLDVLPLFERSGKIWIKVEFADDRQTRQRVVAIQQIENQLYFFASRQPVYWNADFDGVAQALIGLNRETVAPSQIAAE